jgi:large subunit ribosomal protein L13
MKNLTLQTISTKAKDIKRNWHLIDIKDKVLGRTAPEIARYLQGKNKTDYVPYLDTGDFVVVINAKKVAITGKKLEMKTYTRYSGYPGGLKTVKLSALLEKNPGEVIKNAVSGMLPKNKYRVERLKRLFIFSDENHPYKDKFVKL